MRLGGAPRQGFSKSVLMKKLREGPRILTRSSSGGAGSAGSRVVEVAAPKGAVDYLQAYPSTNCPDANREDTNREFSRACEAVPFPKKFVCL